MQAIGFYQAISVILTRIGVRLRGFSPNHRREDATGIKPVTRHPRRARRTVNRLVWDLCDLCRAAVGIGSQAQVVEHQPGVACQTPQHRRKLAVVAPHHRNRETPQCREVLRTIAGSDATAVFVIGAGFIQLTMHDLNAPLTPVKAKHRFGIGRLRAVTRDAVVPFVRSAAHLAFFVSDSSAVNGKDLTDRRKAHILSQIPVQRIGRPDLANFVATMPDAPTAGSSSPVRDTKSAGACGLRLNKSSK